VIVLKSQNDLRIMRQAGVIVAETLAILKESLKAGMTTGELDRIAEDHIRKAGGIPTFIGYQGYPKTLCTSINEEVVHGIPGNRVLKGGDVIGIDCGVTFGGFVADAAETMPVGVISKEDAELIAVTREAMHTGIAAFVAGNRVGDIGFAVQRVAEVHGYGIVKDFVGHGVGQKMHEEPQVPNFGRPATGPRLKVGMVLAIEPMLNHGTGEVKVLSDGWTVVTKDGKHSAHFEHTIALTENGPQILTVV
jgi:methionyl aminopeptidase